MRSRAERLDDALTRILGLKAKLGLHRRPAADLVPPVGGLDVIGAPSTMPSPGRSPTGPSPCSRTRPAPCRSTPSGTDRLRLYCLESAPDFTGIVPEFKRVAVEELTAAGFEVSVFRTAQELAAAGEALDFQTFIAGETDHYTDRFDAALILANVSDFAQQGALRIKWSMPMGPEMPWYAAEVPTVFVSLNMPNHLIDVPMVKTAINAHNPSPGGRPVAGRQAARPEPIPRHPQRQRVVRLLGHPPMSNHRPPSRPERTTSP